MHRINSLIEFRLFPLTSKTDRLYPSEAVVVFEGKESKAMADQLTTVSKARLFRRADILSQQDMRRIEEAIKIQTRYSLRNVR
jgi:mRNA interferase MazF